MYLVFSYRAADRYWGLKLKCGTKGSAWVGGTKPAEVPSKGGSSSSNSSGGSSRRQSDEGARRAMSPKYGDEPGPLGETTTPDCVQPAGCAAPNERPDRSGRIRGVRSATSCCAFQNKALLFSRVLVFGLFLDCIGNVKITKCFICVFLFLF